MHITPNWFAYAILAVWPIISLLLYLKLPRDVATVWSILIAYLLLPPALDIKISGIPAFNKNSIPNLAALIWCIFFAGRIPRIFRSFGLAELFVIVLLSSPFITAMLNGDEIQLEKTVLPGESAYDALSAIAAQFVFMIPFFLGRDLLKGPQNNYQVLRAIAIAGAIYSLPMLLELRISPQLNIWVYGYFPSDFYQEVRSGAFRPTVFLSHGLLVSFFAATATIAAAALWRTHVRAIKGVPSGLLAFYLAIVVVLCRTASALIYTACLAPLIRWMHPRHCVFVAALLGLIALTYPLSRAADVFPTATILNMARAVNDDRAASLQTRFENEDKLLDKAWQRPWFGWGRFGRNRVFDAWDQGDTSITDGHWIITIGTFGIVGFIAEFGLLGLAVYRAAFAIKFLESASDKDYLAALALIVAVNMVDLLPNSSISPWTWLLAGALLGRAEYIVTLSRQRVAPAASRLSKSQNEARRALAASDTSLP